MADPIKVFFVEHTDRVKIYLRRYSGGDKKCSSTRYFCNASRIFFDAPAARDKNGYYESIDNDDGPPRSDPRWPATCEACGERFEDSDPYQIFQDAIMRAPDGRTWPFRELPPGACYNAYWDRHHVGPDGRSLVVILPNSRPWHIDSRANNCTMPEDNVHRCWCRHGSPEDGTLHVDKVGNTCAAGAGSIAVPGYHGFLHNGSLREC